MSPLVFLTTAEGRRVYKSVNPVSAEVRTLGVCDENHAVFCFPLRALRLGEKKLPRRFFTASPRGGLISWIFLGC